MTPWIRCIVAVVLACMVISCSQPDSVANHPQPQPERYTQLTDGPIENLLELAPGLYSGSEPSSQSHYQQLSTLGIKTVISVDAIAPDPDLAQAFGIRIVHLPIGYDGISNVRAVELAAAIEQLEHPIYLHCHHGKHRGPAALCVGAIGAGMISRDDADQFMTQAGTSKNYSGLWTAARDASKLDDSLLSAPVDLPAKAPVSGFIEAMGTIDRLHDRLWDMAEDDWQTPSDHPDLSPTAVSGQIHDLLRALTDSEYVTTEGLTMKRLLDESIEAASDTESAVLDQQDEVAMDALVRLNNSCTDCHDQFR